MKVKDLTTGNVLESTNEIVVEQFKKNPDRYKEIKAEPKKVAEKK